MSVFVVERVLHGINREGLAMAQKAAIDVSRRYSDAGRPLRYIRSTFIPGEERCLCMFEADDQATVADGNKEAGLPFERILEAQDLPAPR